MSTRSETIRKQDSTYGRTLLAALFGLALLGSAAAAAGAEGRAPGYCIVRGGIGVDPIGGGMAVSAGGGYRAPLSRAIWYEGAADIYHHSGSEDWTEDGYTGTTKTQLTLVVARFNFLFNYDDSRAMYPIVGFGFFTGGGEWNETEQSLYYPDITEAYGGDLGGSGNLFNFGLGFKVGARTDIRIEAPVMVFWNSVSGVAIPLTVSTGVHF